MKRLVTCVTFVSLFLGVGGLGLPRVGKAQSNEPPVDLKVLTPGEPSRDTRLQPLKDLDGYFPFQGSSSPAAWTARAERRRQALQVALGLWPLPTPGPLNAVVHGKQAFGDYTIEKVYFESLPGFYVTGNLYRPVNATGRRPAVLSPHGHFPDGRFGDQGVDQVRRQIVVGAERFEEGGRNQLQARCVQLARMGCIAFLYDMIGYCDSTQISYDLAHRFATQRPEMIDIHRWGFFSPQAESMLQSIMGLQTYNSIRALDWISELPDVDPERIAVTGASGGGTQTFILGAIDPRPAVLVPAVMVSTAMQGGCTCENASLLRIGVGNVDFAALIAPRPLCLISADDWTREMPTKGFPELRQHYQMLGVADRLEHHPFLQFGHNYNYVSRSAMYQFMNHHLGLGLPEPVVEEDYPRLTRAELSVWDEAHPRPEGGPEFERQLLQTWARDSRQQLDRARPRDAESLGRYRELVQPAFDAIFHRHLPAADRLEYTEHRKFDLGAYAGVVGILRHRPEPPETGRPEQLEELPVVGLFPHGWNFGPVAIWLDPAGKSSLFNGGQPRAEVRQLLDAGAAVVGVDLMEQGELRSQQGDLLETRRVKNSREAAAYTFGYNDPLFVQRVHDVLSVIGFAVHHPGSPSQIWLVGLNGAGPWAAAARAQAEGRVDRLAVDTQGFRFLNVADIRDPYFLPGGAKYDDLIGLLTLAAPQRLWLQGEQGPDLEQLREAYRVAGDPQALSVAEPDDSAVSWLLEKAR